jgi:putative ABC transport system permease protein
VSQIAITLVLLIGAGLLLRSFVRLVTLSPGFNPENVVTVWIAPPTKKYETGRQVADFYRRITPEFESLPGVEAVGAVSAGPQFGGVELIDVVPEGLGVQPGEYPQARFYDAGPGYFRAMQIPVREGREFTERDDEGAPPVAVVNEVFARRYWPGESAVGKRVALAREGVTLDVVGVVGDVRSFDAAAPVEPEIYWPYMQHPRWSTFFVFRATGATSGLAEAIRARVVAEDGDVFVGRVRPMDALISQAVASPRFDALVVTAFAAVALALAALGLYGAISYSVTQRTFEIGMRMALGARPPDVVRMILRQGMARAAVGVGLGVAAALAASRLLAGMLFGVSATDPSTFAAVSFVLLAVAAAACYVPARRAARVDPLEAVRHD